MGTVLTLLAACDSYPQFWAEPLYVPVLFSIVAFGVFAAGKAAEIREGTPKPFRWVALVPMAVALYSGLSTGNCLLDSIYRSLVTDWGKKGALGHYGAVAFPILVLAGMFVWEWLSKRDSFRA
jgi:hypothetical protein